MLPIKTRLTLKPWFKDATLPEAERLLEQNDCLLLHYRDACAAVFPGLDGYCLVLCRETDLNSQGFLPQKSACTVCGQTRAVDDLCPHIAALMIRILIAEDDNDSSLWAHPAPLLYKQSKWRQVADFLNEYKTTTRIDQDNGHLLLSTDRFTLRLRLADNYPALLAALFGNYPFPADDISAVLAGPASRAWEHLFDLCRTDTESALNQAGTISKGQSRTGGLWEQICHLLFIQENRPAWQLRRQDGLFSLASGPGGEAAFVLTPERKLIMPLLKQTDNLDLVEISAGVRAYNKIYFEDNGNLVIEPWLESADGEKYQRSKMAAYIFGPWFSRRDNIFHAIREHGDDFSSATSGADLPLLRLAAKPDPAASIIIKAPEVPGFLDQHLAEITSGRHEYEPGLEEFTITDLPDAIEVLDYNEDKDWCYLSARYTCGRRHLDLRDILALRTRGKEHATGKDKWLRVRNTPLDWLYDLEARRLDNDNTLRLSRLEMMALTALVPEMRLPTAPDKRDAIKKRLQNLKSGDLAPADIPGHLRPYQQTGLNWLNHLCANGIGGILADDMGLGKTHQALALLQIILRARGGPALVICPASVLPHWQDKIDIFYPELDYEVYYGQQRRFDPPDAARVLLTTYGIMRQDIELLAACPFGLVIFDEIQYLKNRSTSTSKAAASLQSLVSFGLSGTPIENSLTDLKTIYDICLPGLLGGDNEFKRTYVEPIEEDNNQQRLAALRRLTSPFMLRRNKSAVLRELPEIIEDIRHCYLSADQQTLYKQAIDRQGRDLLAAVDDPEKTFPHMNFLALVQRLKQICNHPSQLRRSTEYEQYASGKWELFKEILNECLESGSKVVVFSQYTAMLDIIQRYLRDKAIPHTGLRGKTSMDQRRRQVEKFNNDTDIKVFCASLLAGGTGIDLTGARAVIHYDRWWNSAKEEQATARVHRFGQRQAVQIFKFITIGTMEEKIHQIISKKQSLAEDAIQSDDGSILKKLSREEIAAILRWTPSAS